MRAKVKINPLKAIVLVTKLANSNKLYIVRNSNSVHILQKVVFNEDEGSSDYAFTHSNCKTFLMAKKLGEVNLVDLASTQRGSGKLRMCVSCMTRTPINLKLLFDQETDS